jgi:hypothetical protein
MGPRPHIIIPALDTIDLERLGALLLACLEASHGHFLKIRWQRDAREWQVSARLARHTRRCPCGSCPTSRQHIERDPDSPLLALDRTCAALRTIRAPEGP